MAQIFLLICLFSLIDKWVKKNYVATIITLLVVLAGYTCRIQSIERFIQQNSLRRNRFNRDYRLHDAKIE